jgi:hypothetical protein
MKHVLQELEGKDKQGKRLKNPWKQTKIPEVGD